MRRANLALTALAALLFVSGCGDDGDGALSAAATILFAPEGNVLNAYDLADGFRKQTFIFGNEDGMKPDVPAVNGQVCFDPTLPGRFVTPEDAAQPDPPPHWSVFQLQGERVGELSYAWLERLVPTFQGDVENADPVGCAFLPDGRLLTSDIGNNAAGPPNGQLILWFPPLVGAEARYCKLDIAIGTAGGIYVDDEERIYVASARSVAGIYRYTAPFPTSDDAAGGCGGRDETGAPLAGSVTKELFIADGNVPTPNAIVASGRGTFYVSSIINGVIAEYDADGVFLRRVLEPPSGEILGPTPFSTGSPFGLGVDGGGTLYYSDLGLVIRPGGGIGPGNRLGTVRRIRFEQGVPLAPETIDDGLRFPDGIGLPG